MGIVQYSVKGEVAVLRMDSPPMNNFNYELRVSLWEELERALKDSAIKAVVLMGSETLFSSGADIKEFGTSKVFYEPTLVDLNQYLDDFSKPVIAAIGGVCMGGGLEIALACHFRVAKYDASLSLPEVKLGILPGAGGTQRLPRLVGPEIALNLIVSGTTVPAGMLAGAGLFDEMVSDNLEEGAIAYANKVISEKLPIKRARDIKIDYPLVEGFFGYAKMVIGAAAKNYPAPLKILECVHAAITKPFDEGLKLEKESILNLFLTTESESLRHLFFAERATSKIEDVPADTPIRKIEKVAVIGAGTMGGGIAMTYANSGFPVTLIDSTQEFLDRGLATIKMNYDVSMKKGKLSEDQVQKALALIKPSIALEDVKDADLIIEAVFEEMGLKLEIFKKLDKIAKKGAILASNTSSLNIDKIAKGTSRPEDILGMHYFSPANVMKLLEIVRGAKTAKDVLATALNICKRTKKIGVVSGVCDGFIVNSLLFRYIEQTNYLLLQGCSPAQIDKALEKWGMTMGPFRMRDLSGNDIGWSIYKRNLAENPTMKKDFLTEKMMELGRKGQKAGLGWYRYEEGKRDPIPDPEMDKWIEEYRKKEGVTPRKITDQEIVEHCIYALINEGARRLDEKIADKASDIDIAFIYGVGFPPFRGGPMQYANHVGLFHVISKMRQFQKEPNADKAFWKPSAYMVKLLEAHQNFK